MGLDSGDKFAILRRVDGKTPNTSERIVKVPFPIALIRRMDEAIVIEQGGFRTRAELMREAVENLLNELEFPEAVAEYPSAGADGDLTDPAPSNALGPSIVDQLLAGLPDWEREELTLSDLAGSALRAPTRQPALVSDGAASATDEPLLGLHNRDYVSIWALHRLARYTADGSLPFEEYLRQVTKAAWFYGAQLEALETRDVRKLTVLFPTNSAKRPSAERGFQSFAVGNVGRLAQNGGLPTTGPLFAWRAIQVRSDGELTTGLTEPGWRLVRDLDGLSLNLPHPPELTSRFLSYLGRHAPGDLWGFDHLLRVVAGGPDREALVESFAANHPEWSGSTASSVAQGYVARSREWGLVEPRLVEGRYWLTDVGRGRLRELDEHHQIDGHQGGNP